ncbi:YciI family protein [Bowmanella denitrificans]|uniref:YciI family protein n=1 Tax=Bowmanella denitrificans TaxID=366582 RepID=UPI000C99F41A|nr:YciI family protein [Bowmanella denitrificans]
MKYVCLVYYDEQIIRDMSEQQWLDLNKECIAFGEQVRGSGHCIGGNALQMTDTASTVRIRAGQLQLSDGPFAETKEQLAGFYLMEAKDLNEAIQLAGRIPPARLGSIEIRPVRELPK